MCSGHHAPSLQTHNSCYVNKKTPECPFISPNVLLPQVQRLLLLQYFRRHPAAVRCPRGLTHRLHLHELEQTGSRHARAPTDSSRGSLVLPPTRRVTDPAVSHSCLNSVILVLRAGCVPTPDPPGDVNRYIKSHFIYKAMKHRHISLHQDPHHTTSTPPGGLEDGGQAAKGN